MFHFIASSMPVEIFWPKTDFIKQDRKLHVLSAINMVNYK